MADLLTAEAFSLWGAPTTWLEVIAFALAMVMVAMNIRELHWGWPLGAASSALYFWVFWRSGLYADAALQVVFTVLAAWGWAQWLSGRRGDGSPLAVARLSRGGAAAAVGAWLLLWPVVAALLIRFTDSTVPWWDAFPTAGSLVGQYLIARKYLENWAAWLVVNVVSIGLYAVKGLWLTLLLYALFAVLSVVGWRAWRRRMAP